MLGINLYLIQVIHLITFASFSLGSVIVELDTFYSAMNSASAIFEVIDRVSLMNKELQLSTGNWKTLKVEMESRKWSSCSNTQFHTVKPLLSKRLGIRL